MLSTKLYREGTVDAQKDKVIYGETYVPMDKRPYSIHGINSVMLSTGKRVLNGHSEYLNLSVCTE